MVYLLLDGGRTCHSVHGSQRTAVESALSFYLHVDLGDRAWVSHPPKTWVSSLTQQMLYSLSYLSGPKPTFWPLTMGLYIFNKNTTFVRGTGYTCLFLFVCFEADLALLLKLALNSC